MQKVAGASFPRDMDDEHHCCGTGCEKHIAAEKRARELTAADKLRFEKKYISPLVEPRREIMAVLGDPCGCTPGRPHTDACCENFAEAEAAGAEVSVTDAQHLAKGGSF